MRRRRGTPALPAGFALLEAVVALAVFAGAAMALYSLFNTNLVALFRAGDVTRQMSAARHAVQHLSAIDPRDEGTGRIRFDGLDVDWSARLLQPVRQSQTAIGNRGYFEVGLYEVEFALSDRGRPLGVWRLRVPGWEKVRGPAP